MFMKILKRIKRKIDFYNFKMKYKKANKDNFTTPTNIFNRENVKVGKCTYGCLNIEEFGGDNEFLEIGSYCSIADNVTFLLSGEHNYKTLSTYPFKNKILKKGDECTGKGKITIDDDVWIGYGATILSGVHIGQGAIIGAGTVVAKDVPPYAIYVNGKILKYRFEEEVINKLKNIDFSKLSKEKIEGNIDVLYEEINANNIDDIIRKIDIKK